MEHPTFHSFACNSIVVSPIYPVRSETLGPLDMLLTFAATPYALLLDDNAPILQLDPRAWPFPQAIRGNGPAISVWMPGKSIPIPDARSLRPCLLKSAQVVPWITQSVDYLVFKNEVIQWVNKRLVDPEHATSDMTIGVLICLMSWEVSDLTGLRRKSKQTRFLLR